MYHFIERAVLVDREYKLDRQYVVRDGEIVIVDEFTGRLAEGRKWREGLHQAVEANAGVEVTVETGQAARITIQDFFLRYEKLAGMTGTATDSAAELQRIYKCHVVPIPTNKPAIRQRLATQVFGHEEAKWLAVVDEVCEMYAQRRPVLIGTRSIDKSDIVSRLLTARGVPHQVLNANHVAEEAEIVRKAGEEGHVTVSTNMAGRGTDIKLGDGIREMGGLHVFLTEMHDASRVDRQLIGRCGRQGDPGTFRQYLSLEDDLLLAGLGPKKSDRLKARGESGGAFDHLSPLYRRAQLVVERRHFRQRRALMYFEKERKKMQQQMGQDPYLDTPGA
jgi:preprotein translocase subunit SecA